MRITADQIQLRNLTQLAKVTKPNGVTVMGRLNEVSYGGSVFYTLTVGGSTFTVPADHPVDIRRSANLDELVTISDDLSERLTSEPVA